MATCKKCGKEIGDNAFLCVYCGTLTESGNKMQYKPTPVKRNSAYTLGVIGMVFALFFQLVTWICSGIGLAKTIEEKKRKADSARTYDDTRAWASNETPQCDTHSQTDDEQTQYQQECEDWQRSKAFQLNLWALIISVCMFVVWLLGGLSQWLNG